MDDLQKITATKTIGRVRVDCDDSAAETLKCLASMLRKAGKNHTDIRIQLQHDEGDDNTLPSDYIALIGKTEESDLEWHRRLEHEKYVIKRNLDEAHRRLSVEPMYLKNISAIEAALEKSPLRCVDCGKPESGGINSQATKGKTLRICSECHDKREKKMGLE